MARKDVVNPDGSLNLTKRIQEIVEYAFANPSHSQKQMAEHFQVRASYISQIMNSTRVMQAYPLLAKRKRQGLIPKALKVEEDLLKSDNDEVRRKVVASVYADHKISGNTEINVNLTLKDLSESDIADKLARLGAVGPAVDASVVLPSIAHHLDKEVSSDEKEDITPNNTPNDAP